MSTVLGYVLANLAKRAGGQAIVELPDDLTKNYIKDLIDGANQAPTQQSPFAVFAHNNRDDLADIKPAVDFRELAKYRSAQRLAFVYAGDNPGMSTYTSVFPPLFSPTFPDESNDSINSGLACLLDFLREVADTLSRVRKLSAQDEADLHVAVIHIGAFLTDVYLSLGNGKQSLAADWWVHFGAWLDNAYSSLNESEALAIVSPAKLCFAAAGLPAPTDGSFTYSQLTPRTYIDAVCSRWSSAQAVAIELERLQNFESSRDAAQMLANVPWETEFSSWGELSQSPALRLCLGGVSKSAPVASASQRLAGWARFLEEDFCGAYETASGMLKIAKAGVRLPVVSSAETHLLVVSGEEDNEGQGRDVYIDEVTLTIPWREGNNIGQVCAEDLGALSVVGQKSVVVTFAPRDCVSRSDGLHVVGSLKLTLPAKPPGFFSISARSTGALAGLLVDVADCQLCLIRSRVVACFVQPTERRRRSDAKGPFFAQGSDLSEIAIKRPGRYEVTLAAGPGAAIEPSSLSLASEKLSDRFRPEMRCWSAQVNLSGDEILRSGETELFYVGVESEKRTFLSPIVAAATATRPETRPIGEMGFLGWLERELLSCFGRSPDRLPAAFVASSRSGPREFIEPNAGVLLAPQLRECAASLSPGFPDEQLTSHAAYQRLSKVYKGFGMEERLAQLEEEFTTHGLTVSRLRLDEFISEDQVLELLQAYVELVKSARDMSRSNAFWARNPFSAVIFEDVRSRQDCLGILLSPLHPIRLAWLWSVESTLAAACEDGVPAAQLLGPINGDMFPVVSSDCDAAVGIRRYFTPAPLDSGPESLYAGWQAMLEATQASELKPPEWVMGDRFPASGLSGLSSGAVSNAVDDFRRVFPQVRNLGLFIDSPRPANRSKDVDDGVLAKIAELAVESSSPNGVGSVGVSDSINRLGSLPTFSDIHDELSEAAPSFSVSWKLTAAGSVEHGGHIALMEGSSAMMRVASTPTTNSVGWIPKAPLRRFPMRIRRQANYLGLDYSLSDEICSDDSSFASALRVYEASNEGDRLVTWITPNFATLPTRPNWLVTGDFGVDPDSLATACSGLPDSQYMLWDWRPGAALSERDAGFAGKTHPYFILAKLPPTLTQAIADRIGRLGSGLDSQEVERRIKRMVEVLSKRAIGLNTLLAIGHHQATGALGFYFALESLSVWMSEAKPGERRFVIPVDAIDPLLRRLSGASLTQETLRKRVDLLAVTARLISRGGESCSEILLTPIEIKHYGLMADANTQAAFPRPNDSSLRPHLEQVAAYSEQLERLTQRLTSASGSERSLTSLQFAMIIESAALLSPLDVDGEANVLLRNVCEGSFTVRQTDPVVLLYQPAAAASAASAPTQFNVVPHSDFPRHMLVCIDPIRCERSFWGDSDDTAHQPVVTALRNAFGGPFALTATDSGAPQEPLAGSRETTADDPSPAHTPEATTDSSQSAVGSTAASAQISDITQIPIQQSMSPDELTAIYDNIRNTFLEHSIRVEAPVNGQTPFAEGPSFVEFALSPGHGVRVSKIEQQSENLKLRLALPESAKIGFRTHLGNILINVPKKDEDRYFVTADALWAKWRKPSVGFAIPLGEDIRGNVVHIELSNSTSPHLLIAGTTGSGKSEALMTLLRGATHFYSEGELCLMMVDPKTTELVGLKGLPHCGRGIGETAQDAVELMNLAVAEMEGRYARFAQAGVKSIDEYNAIGETLPRWMLVLDEYADLTTDRDDKKNIEQLLRRLSQKARAAGIHVVVSTQKPTVEVVNTVVKSNLPARVALQVVTAAESRVILDESGAEELTGKGDALLKIGNNRTRLQFAKCS